MSSARSSTLPTAWSAYLAPGLASNRSAPADALAEVLPELPLGRPGAGRSAVGGLVELVADAVAHAGGARRPAHVVVRRVAGDLGLGPLVGLPGLAAEPVHGGGGVGLGDLEPAALAGGPGPDDAGQHAERAEQRTGVDAHRRVLGDGGEAVLGDLGLHQPGPHVVGDAVARQVLVGAGHAVARDGAEHDPGVDLAELVVAEAAALEAAGAHGLDDDVGVAHQVEVGLRRPRACAGRARCDRLPRLMWRCISETPSTMGHVIWRM